MKNGERGLRDHLSRRITNASDTCRKIFHRGQYPAGRGAGARARAVTLAIGRAPYPERQRRSDPAPAPRVGGGGRARPGTSHLSLSGPPSLSAPRLTGTSGPPPPPLRLRLRQLKSQQGPATWARPAGPLRGGRRVAALRARREELRGVCWSRSLGGPPTRA